MTQTYDAIIIGGGHNGLINAAYLARAGKKALVLEQRPLVGGAAVTEEINPGFDNPGELFQFFFYVNIGTMLQAYPGYERQIDPQLLANLAEVKGVSGQDYARVILSRSAIFDKIQRLFATYDVLLCPTVAVPPFAVGIEGPTLTRHLDGLEAAGLVRRIPHPDDRRAFQVEPTAAGEKLHAELLQVVIAFNRRLTAGLSEGDLDNLRAGLVVLEANVRPR